MGDNGTARPGLKVLRIVHHGVVDAWRERERELRRLGLDVTMVSAKRWNEGGADIDLDVGDDDFVVGVATVGTHPNGFLYDPRPLWTLLGQRWDIVDLHEEPCASQTAEVLALMRLRGLHTPVVMYAAQNIEKRYPVPIRWLERIALRRADGAYVCNTEAGRILRDKGLRGQPRVIGLGTDLSVFTPGDHQAPRRPLRVGYAGRLEAYKGVHVLLRAVAVTPDSVLEIAGDGPQRGELEALSRDLGIADRVRFLGHLGADLPAFYRDQDVLVVPSLPTPGWLEQFGRVVVEAMASGAVVIASRSGALPDVVGDAGILVEPDNPAQIAAALARVAEPGEWTRLRAAGLAHARQYSWEEVARAQASFYDDVLAEATPGRAGRPGVHVLVVAYGPPTTLDAALAGVDGLPVTVVDNSSLPQTRDVAERHGATYIDAGDNLGFAGGVNLGLAAIAAGGEDPDVLLLNPDATITAAGVSTLQDALRARPWTACVAPRQEVPGRDEPERVTWPFPSPAGAWLVASGLGGLDRRHGFVIGSVLLLNRDALRDLGGFDERFFLYAEETDWQKRAVDRGWSVRYVPQVTGTHIGAGTSTDEGLRSQQFHTSQLTYIRKHFGAGGEAAFRAAVVAGAAVRVLVGRGETRDAARWRLRFYLTGHGRAS